MAAVGFFLRGHGRDAPAGGDLGGGIGAVYEVVVDGVAPPCSCSPTGVFLERGPTQAGATPSLTFWAIVEADGAMTVQLIA